MVPLRSRAKAVDSGVLRSLRAVGKGMAKVFLVPCMALVLFLAFSLPVVGKPSPAAPTEYALKAVCLYNFLHFVSRPESDDLEDPSTPLVIGIVGESPFEDALEQLQVGLQAGKRRKLSVVEYGSYRRGMTFDKVQLLFICGSEKQNLSGILAQLNGKPVLTVADYKGFVDAGGMITLVRKSGKIRWRINLGAVRHAGLRASAKLLGTALDVVDVHSGKPGGVHRGE